MRIKTLSDSLRTALETVLYDGPLPYRVILPRYRAALLRMGLIGVSSFVWGPNAGLTALEITGAGKVKLKIDAQQRGA